LQNLRMRNGPQRCRPRPWQPDVDADTLRRYVWPHDVGRVGEKEPHFIRSRTSTDYVSGVKVDEQWPICENQGRAPRTSAAHRRHNGAVRGPGLQGETVRQCCHPTNSVWRKERQPGRSGHTSSRFPTRKRWQAKHR